MTPRDYFLQETPERPFVLLDAHLLLRPDAPTMADIVAAICTDTEGDDAQ